MNYDLQPGDLVRSNATVYNRAGEIRKPTVGLVLKKLMTRDHGSGSGLVKVLWPRTGNTGVCSVQDLEKVEI
jgi:hypothetical protein